MVEFIIIVLVILFIIGTMANSGARSKAKTAYQASLGQLSKDPTNSDLRKRTLDLGRVYSNLTRNNKGVSLFDEVALMNDINAACGGVTAIAKSSNPPVPPVSVGASLENRLVRLAQLRDKGLISNDEYQAKRQQLLNEV